MDGAIKTIYTDVNNRDELLNVATAIYPKCISTVEDILRREGGIGDIFSQHNETWLRRVIGEKFPQTAASKMAIRYAAELIHQVNVYHSLTPELRSDF